MFLLLAVVFASIPHSAEAQKNNKNKKQHTQQAVRKIAWLTPMEYDFGDIPQGKPVKYKFTFVNTTPQSIYLDNVRTMCGCTASEWSFSQIAPKDTSTIDIEFDAKEEGYFKKRITVFVHGQKQSEDLIITGTVLDIADQPEGKL